MSNKNFDKYIEEEIKNNPELKEELEKVDRAVEIAYQIYSLRKKRGLTQLQLAKKIGVSQSNIARIERADYKHYSRMTLDKVASGLNADLNIFISLPEQTNRLISVYNSSPTIQSFKYLATEGRYYLSALGAFNKEKVVTFDDDLNIEKVKFLTLIKNSAQRLDRYNI